MNNTKNQAQDYKASQNWEAKIARKSRRKHRYQDVKKQLQMKNQVKKAKANM